MAISSINSEQLVQRISGLNSNGDVITVCVYKKGASIRLSSGMSSYLIDLPNEKSSEGWAREAARVWNLIEVYSEPLHSTNSGGSRERFNELQAEGEKIKGAAKL